MGSDFDLNIVPEYAKPYLSLSANYMVYSQTSSNVHYSLNITNYAHLSSPMRRFIDMLNHLGFYGLDWTNVIKSINKIDNINPYLHDINMQIKNQKKIKKERSKKRREKEK